MRCNTSPAPRRGTRGPAGLLALAITLLAASATAQPPPDATQLFREGMALREAGDLRGAIERLERAHRADPADDRTTFNLASALVEDGRVVAARQLLVVLVAGERSDLLIADAAREMLATTSRRIAYVTLELDPGAIADGVERRVAVDGARQPEGVREVSLDPGAHRIEVVDARGNVVARGGVEVSAGERRALRLRPVAAGSTLALDVAGGGLDPAATSIPAGGQEGGDDDVWLWVGIGGGVALVLGAVAIGTAVALSSQGAAPIDGDLPDVVIGALR